MAHTTQSKHSRLAVDSRQPNVQQSWSPIVTALNVIFHPLPLDASCALEDRPSLSPAQYMHTSAALMNWCRRVNSLPDDNIKDVVPSIAGTSLRGGDQVYKMVQDYLNTVCIRIRKQLECSNSGEQLLAQYLAQYDLFLDRLKLFARVGTSLDAFAAREAQNRRAWYQQINSELAKKYSVRDIPDFLIETQPWLEPLLEAEFDLQADDEWEGTAWKQAMLRAETTTDPNRFPLSISGTGKRAWRIHVAEPLQVLICATLAAPDVNMEGRIDKLSGSFTDIGLMKDHPIRLALTCAPSNDKARVKG